MKRGSAADLGDDEEVGAGYAMKNNQAKSGLSARNFAKLLTIVRKRRWKEEGRLRVLREKI